MISVFSVTVTENQLREIEFGKTNQTKDGSLMSVAAPLRILTRDERNLRHNRQDESGDAGKRV
jgi:hypothetical protein